MRQNQSKIALMALTAMEIKLGIKMIHAGRGSEKIVAGAPVDAYFERNGKKYVVQVRYKFFNTLKILKLVKN